MSRRNEQATLRATTDMHNNNVVAAPLPPSRCPSGIRGDEGRGHYDMTRTREGAENSPAPHSSGGLQMKVPPRAA